MSEEEWIFFFILAGAGILALAILIIDAFSLHQFWARRTRSKRPPTPEMLVKAHTKHQQFYRKTHQRLFKTTYVSFYLFVLSFLGILFINAFIVIQDAVSGVDRAADERLLRLFYITFFFLFSRWSYRQERHYTTFHKLAAVITCVIIIDLVHLITGADYILVTLMLIIFWMWVMGSLQAILSYDVNYTRNAVFSLGIPFAVIYFLIYQGALVIVLIFAPVLFFVLLEFLVNFTNYEKFERFFSSLPFNPAQPRSFLKDVFYSVLPRVTFSNCSVWEVLYWGFMTPFVLVPVTMYLQSREEQLQQQHDNLLEWSKTEYILSPDTVADRLGLTLEDTYPLLNELAAEGKLTLYQSAEGLLYGLPLSEEMKAFIKKMNLRKTKLPEKDRELLEYIEGKERVKPPTAGVLSIVKRSDGIEISAERTGGTISALKPSILANTSDDLERIAHDMNRLIGTTVSILSYFGGYRIKNLTTFLLFLSLLQRKGKELLKYALPEPIMDDIEMSHIVLETNVHAIPFELMWIDQFFALKYAVGRRLRVTRPVRMRNPEDTETLRALIIADPTSNLKGALTECNNLTAELDKLIDTDYITQTEATCGHVKTLLQSGYTIIHYAGHVNVDENGLQLSDGVLDSHTIQENLRGSPLVFINGCKSAGIAHTELAEAFLQGGALGYIGSLWDIHDVAAAELAINFYTSSLNYYTIGEALRMAKERALQEHSIAWLCFVLFGDPTLRLI